VLRVKAPSDPRLICGWMLLPVRTLKLGNRTSRGHGVLLLNLHSNHVGNNWPAIGGWFVNASHEVVARV
jgi:hypothetical protein